MLTELFSSDFLFLLSTSILTDMNSDKLVDPQAEDIEDVLEPAPEDDDLDNSVDDLLEESSSSDSGREAERDSPFPGELRGRKRRMSPPPSPPAFFPLCMSGRPWACPDSCPLSWHHETAVALALAGDSEEPLEMDHPPSKRQKEDNPPELNGPEDNVYVSLEEGEGGDLPVVQALPAVEDRAHDEEDDFIVL